jgi:hypothetical protein
MIERIAGTSDLGVGSDASVMRITAQPEDCRRQLEMRRVDHFSIELDGAHAGIGIKRGNDGACVRTFRFARHECCIDNRNLRWMDRHHAGKSVTTSVIGVLCKPIKILEGWIDRLDCRHAGRVCAEQSKRPGKLIGLGIFAAGLARSRGADGGGQIFRSPGQAGSLLLAPR